MTKKIYFMFLLASIMVSPQNTEIKFPLGIKIPDSTATYLSQYIFPEIIEHDAKYSIIVSKLPSSKKFQDTFNDSLYLVTGYCAHCMPIVFIKEKSHLYVFKYSEIDTILCNFNKYIKECHPTTKKKTIYLKEILKMAESWYTEGYKHKTRDSNWDKFPDYYEEYLIKDDN